MNTPATYDDVNLILRLYEQRREEKLRTARAWFFANFYPRSLAELQQLCPVGSQENAYMRMVTSYWEMVASFVTAGVLNSELLFQSNSELLMTWGRVSPVIGEWRAFAKFPVFRNLEAVAADYTAYMDRMSPGAAAAFAARVGTRPPKAASDPQKQG